MGVLSQTCAPLPALVLSSIPTLGHVAAASVSCFAKECDGVDFSGGALPVLGLPIPDLSTSCLPTPTVN